MLADERGEHLYHGRVVSRGVAGDALQGVDAADAYVELVRAELLDGLRVASVTCPCSVSSWVRRCHWSACSELRCNRPKFTAVKTSAATAARPAPSVSGRPLALSTAVSCSGPPAEPTSWRASQSASGTNSAQTNATASRTAAPPASHRMPRGQPARLFSMRGML